MNSSRLVLGAVIATVVAALAGSAVADDTGFASMHDWRRERGRTCFLDHYHYGNGSGKTKKAAEIDAIKSWSSFTDLEYGSDWARFSRAASKAIKCQPASSGWECSIEARPCR